jgi:hypothetical protein
MAVEKRDCRDLISTLAVDGDFNEENFAMIRLVTKSVAFGGPRQIAHLTTKSNSNGYVSSSGIEFMIHDTEWIFQLYMPKGKFMYIISTDPWAGSPVNNLRKTTAQTSLRPPQSESCLLYVVPGKSLK